jgi:hypothetical protein
VEVVEHLGRWKLSVNRRAFFLFQRALSQPIEQYNLFTVSKFIHSLSLMQHAVGKIYTPYATFITDKAFDQNDEIPYFRNMATRQDHKLNETILTQYLEIQAEAIRAAVEILSQNTHSMSNTADLEFGNKRVFNVNHLKNLLFGCAKLCMTWGQFSSSTQEGLLYLIKYYLPRSNNVHEYASISASLRKLAAFPPTGLMIVSDEEAKEDTQTILRRHLALRNVNQEQYDALEKEYRNLQKRLIAEFSPIFTSFMNSYVPATESDQAIFDSFINTWSAFENSFVIP